MPEKSHGERNLAGYSPWGCKEVGMTEWLSTHTELLNNTVLDSGVQQSDAVIHIHISILFQIIFPFRLLLSFNEAGIGSPHIDHPV